LLIVEQDAQAERTLYYLFEGELGRANLGIPDLRRVAFDFGYADIRFDFPLSRYRFGAGHGGGGEGGAGGEPTSAPAPVRTLSVDGQSVDLFEVTDATAYELGVTRFLGVIASADYRVKAFWGSRESAKAFGSVRWPSGARILEHEAELSPSELRLSQGEEDEVLVDNDPFEGADYKVVDLFQRIVRSEEGDDVDALVRTSLGVQTEYRATPELLSSVWHALCWTSERPLFARVEQVARSYHRAHDGGDFAVIHKRRDFARVPRGAWRRSAPEGEPPGYCDDYE
jgi:hypothetical protein